MYNNDKWVYSSTGRYMFVSYSPGILSPNPGFLAKIHYGNEITDIKKFAHQIIDLINFLVNCDNVINGKIGFCTCHSCSEDEGDCNLDDECQDGLRCGNNNCPDSFGFDAHTDCCYYAGPGSVDFCSVDEPCEADEGDCDSHDECKSHLYCGINNCPNSLGFLSSVDCCEPKGEKNNHSFAFTTIHKI